MMLSFPIQRLQMSKGVLPLDGTKKRPLCPRSHSKRRNWTSKINKPVPSGQFRLNLDCLPHWKGWEVRSSSCCSERERGGRFGSVKSQTSGGGQLQSQCQKAYCLSGANQTSKSRRDDLVKDRRKSLSRGGKSSNWLWEATKGGEHVHVTMYELRRHGRIGQRPLQKANIPNPFQVVCVNSVDLTTYDNHIFPRLSNDPLELSAPGFLHLQSIRRFPLLICSHRTYVPVDLQLFTGS